MRNVLVAALTLAAAPAFSATLALKSGKIPANATVKMTVSIGAVSTTQYNLTSKNSYTAGRVKATATGAMSITMEGQTQSKIIPPSNSDEQGKGTLAILSNNEVELRTDGGNARMKATIVRDSSGSITSLKVSDKEMLKAVNAMIASSQGDQVRALQANPALAYAVVDMSGMNCSGQGDTLTCDQSMKISMGLGQ